MELKNIFKIFCRAIVCAATFMILLSSFACAVEGLPPGTEEILNKIQPAMYPPEVHDVSMIPPVPAAGQSTIVTAKIYNNGNLTEDQTIQAWIIYSADGGDTWETIEMTQMDDQKSWTGKLPPFEKGTEVLYGFRAYDTSGNEYTETPCLVTSWPPDGDPCMFGLSVDDDPVDDPSEIIPDDFDILSVSGGADEQNLYFGIEVQGRVSDGTISPVYTHIYGIGVQNPDEGDGNSIISQGFLAIWSPLASSIGLQSCMVLSQPAGMVVRETNYIKCLTNGKSRLWFKIDMKAVGGNPSGYVKLIAADGALTDFSPLDGLYYDYTNISSLSLRDRRFVAK
jgi:hypothetical protein